MDSKDRRIAELEAENERLRRLVKDGYLEGYEDGWSAGDGISQWNPELEPSGWSESVVRKTLDQLTNKESSDDK